MFGATAIVPVVRLMVNGPLGVDVSFTCPAPVPITTGRPFTVSFKITLGVLVPGNTLDESAIAIIDGALIVTIAVAVSQLIGLINSQMVYGIEYVPAVTFTATFTIPVAGFILNCAVAVEVNTTFPAVTPIAAKVPFKVSFVITLGVVPFTAVSVSLTASITGAVTVTVTVTVSQLVGLVYSQMV